MQNNASFSQIGRIHRIGESKLYRDCYTHRYVLNIYLGEFPQNFIPNRVLQKTSQGLTRH